MVDERIDESSHWGERQGLALAQFGPWLDLQSLTGQASISLWSLRCPSSPNQNWGGGRGNPGFILPITPQPPTDALELLPVNMPPMIAHTPVRKCVKDLAEGHRAQQAPLPLPGPGPSLPHPHLCFSVSFTIMGESS